MLARFTVTYDIITRESAAEGCTADGGYIDPRTGRRRSLAVGRKREQERTLAAARAGGLDWSLGDAIAWIEQQSCGYAETDWTPENNHCGLTVYFQDAYETHSTDARGGVVSINYALHCKGLSDGSYMRLARALRARRVYFANAAHCKRALERSSVAAGWP